MAAIDDFIKSLMTTGTSNAAALFGGGSGSVDDATSYLQKIVGGNRAAMMGAIQPEVKTLRDQSYNTTKAASMFAPSGGGRSDVLAQEPYNLSANIGNLLATERPAAAKSLSDIGLTELGLSQQELSNMLWGAFQQRGQDMQKSQNLQNLLAGVGTSVAKLIPWSKIFGAGAGSTVPAVAGANGASAAAVLTPAEIEALPTGTLAGASQLPYSSIDTSGVGGLLAGGVGAGAALAPAAAAAPALAPAVTSTFTPLLLGTDLAGVGTGTGVGAGASVGFGVGGETAGATAGGTAAATGGAGAAGGSSLGSSLLAIGNIAAPLAFLGAVGYGIYRLISGVNSSHIATNASEYNAYLKDTLSRLPVMGDFPESRNAQTGDFANVDGTIYQFQTGSNGTANGTWNVYTPIYGM